jgi:hypothetical protein
MSVFRKIYKTKIFLIGLFVNYFRQGSQCILICDSYEFEPLVCMQLLRRSELLTKIGYTVRLKLSLSERQFLMLD